MVSKSKVLWFDRRILVLLIVCYIQNVTSFWEYAVCTKQRIILYDEKWEELEPKITKSGCEYMNAITYDPVNEIFYFADRKHPETSIFSLKVRDDQTFVTTSLVARSPNETIEDLVYDVHDKALYWSDSGNSKIVKMVIDRSKSSKFTQETFLNVNGRISGLEIDTCQRNLYFTLITEAEPSINVVSLEKIGLKATSFGSENHFKPVAIAMDHQSQRLYVADVRQYNSYSIDSVLMSGKGFRTEIMKTSKTPRSLAVDVNKVYYIEANNNEIRQFVKESGDNSSTYLKTLPSDPSDIIIRNNFLIDWDTKICKIKESKLKEIENEKKEAEKKQEVTKMCLHGGSLDKTSSSCICTENFDGNFCEVNLCYNFCLNKGDCSMSKNEYSKKLEPVCSCMKGFDGKHCEVDLCSNFCLNDGTCTVGFTKKPKCDCSEKFTGSRCENLKVNTLPVINKSQDDVNKETSTTTTESKLPESTEHEVPYPEDDNSSSHNLLGKPDVEVHSELTQCPETQVNPTIVILAVCLTISFLIFLVILVVIKKTNRPLRPKIRKKYVVHKNMDQSLTYRPTTEQCEVIIEDCCNMNICETPCFDPKVLQQEINEGNISVKLTSSKKCSSKEDKQDLLKNIEYNQ